MAGVPSLAQGPGVEGRPPGGFGQVSGPGGGVGGGVPAGRLAALCGALVPQRVQGRSAGEAGEGGDDAEGDPRPGGRGSGDGEGRGCGGEAGVDEASQGGRDGAERLRRDAGVHEVSADALAEPADEQSAGADHEGDPATDACGRRVPGRTECVDAGGGASAAHCRHALGSAEVPADGLPAGAVSRAGVAGGDDGKLTSTLPLAPCSLRSLRARARGKAQ